MKVEDFLKVIYFEAREWGRINKNRAKSEMEWNEAWQWFAFLTENTSV